MSDNEINSQDILNAIDMNKINQVEKKRRGRPKKTQMISSNSKIKIPINDDDYEQEEEEIILHLPISREDIKLFGNDDIDLNELTEKSINSSENDDSSTKDIKVNDINMKQYGFIIKKLKEENDELKKYLTDITPMYFTEVKIYPLDLKLFSMENNELIPKKTQICCWWCTYQFDCLPTYLPEKYCDNKFYVSGCYCSFNCAGAYNLNLNDNKIWERYSLLKQLYYMINKDKIITITDIEINIAGPKELLEKFGGPMTIIDYRKNAKILGREYHKLIPPFLPITIGFEETTNSKTCKSIGINSIINSKTDNILIKRNKPLSNIASKHIDNYIE
jgi:hypothetical protein